jgi:predicted  nucleic acid-binding Zn ribbon protein
MNVQKSDLYFKLKPPAPTPEDEICKCADKPPIKLMSALTYNPMHCMNCNLEVLPQELGISEKVAECIANWRRVCDAIYMLWLDSGDYEDWAKSQLQDLTGQVNRTGRQSQTELNKIRRCYYALFEDSGNLESEPTLNCPDCKKTLQEYKHGKFSGQWLTCEDCFVVVSRG